MPPRAVILASLSSIANDFAALAVAWHVVLAAALLAWLLGWRPTKRTAAAVMLLPLGSVGAVAALAGNPFNAVGAAVSILALRLSARRIPSEPVERGDDGGVAAGWMMIAFGWAYPHFLELGSPATYVIAAPLGLLPCPTLAVIVGLTLAAGELGSRAWAVILATFALFYGLFGVLYLHVWLDAVLVAGALVLLGHAVMQRGSATDRGRPEPVVGSVGSSGDQ